MRSYLIEERDSLWFVRLFEAGIEENVIIECKTESMAKEIAMSYINQYDNIMPFVID